MIASIIKLAGFMTFTASIALVAMMFSPTELTALMVAASALLATIFVGIVNIITARRIERKADVRGEKLDEVHTEAKVIGGHVNSMATAATAKIEAQQKEIDTLTRLLAETKQTAAVLAQSSADVAVLAPIAETVAITTPKPT